MEHFYPERPPRPCVQTNTSTAHPDYDYLKKYTHDDYDGSFLRNIKFCHPAYDQNCNILFELPAIDHPDGGIHYGLAIDACAIVANNRWDGFLSSTADAEAAPLKPPEANGRDSILKIPESGSLYYHLGGPEPGIGIRSSLYSCM
jgi:hypothetical protein